MQQHDCLPDLTILDGSEPTRPLGGSLFDPRPDRLDDQDVGKARYDGLATGAELERLRRHEPKRVRKPIDLIEVGRLEMNDVGEEGDQMARRRMSESHHAADERRMGASPTVAEDGVAITEALVVKLIDARGGQRARIAKQPVVQSMRDEREVASLEQPTLDSDFEPTGPCREKLTQFSRLGSSSAQGSVSSHRQ